MDEPRRPRARLLALAPAPRPAAGPLRRPGFLPGRGWGRGRLRALPPSRWAPEGSRGLRGTGFFLPWVARLRSLCRGDGGSERGSDLLKVTQMGLTANWRGSETPTLPPHSQRCQRRGPGRWIWNARGLKMLSPPPSFPLPPPPPFPLPSPFFFEM